MDALRRTEVEGAGAPPQAALALGPLEQQLFDASPSAMLVLDAHTRVLAANRAARALLGPGRDWLLRPGGEALHCLNAEPAGCGRAPACTDCLIRSAVARVLANGQVARERTALALRNGRGLRELWMLVSGAPVDHAGVRHALVTLEDVTALVRARALLPMCAHCRRPRSDDHFWTSVKEYLEQHHDEDVSQGLCLDCARDVHGLTWSGE